MRVVYKYPIAITDRQMVAVHKEAGTSTKIVHAGLDPNGIPCVWIELIPGTYIETYEICVIGTGNPIHGNVEHIGSFVQKPFVWHIYV